MIMYEQESEVLSWGFGLLQSDLFSDSAFCGSTAHQDSNFFDIGYIREDNTGTEHTSSENDGFISHALQGEFSQLAVAEVSRPADADEHMQSSILEQDWFGPYMRTYTSGNESVREETDDMEPSSSCSSPEVNCYEEEEEWSFELTDDFSDIDDEVGKRLNQMVPIPHIPRINGEIPSTDEATSDHQRLIERLQLYELVERKVLGDGNCQFRALSDQIYRSPEHHKFVREQVVNQLQSHPEIYEGYVPMEYGDYVEKLSKNGEWGDHVTLQAAADSYGTKIFVITSFKDTCFIEILPSLQKSNRLICLSFWAEVHYNSIYPECSDFPTSDTKKKKRWWQFGNRY